MVGHTRTTVGSPRAWPTWPTRSHPSPSSTTGFESSELDGFLTTGRAGIEPIESFSYELLEDQISESDFSHTTNHAILTARRDMADTYADTIVNRSSSLSTSLAYASSGRRWEEFSIDKRELCSSAKLFTMDSQYRKQGERHNPA